MAQTYSVSLAKIIKEFSLETVFLPDNPNELYVESADLNRPGLQFSGFYEYFDGNRIQIIGRNEMSFLLKFSQEERAEKFEELVSNRPPAVVITRNIELFDGMEDSARKHGVPLLRTSDTTSSFMSALISFLNIELAPRITRHGVLVEVYGEGILMLGESGVGKSGHRAYKTRTPSYCRRCGRDKARFVENPCRHLAGQHTAFYRAAWHRDCQRQTYIR